MIVKKKIVSFFPFEAKDNSSLIKHLIQVTTLNALNCNKLKQLIVLFHLTQIDYRILQIQVIIQILLTCFIRNLQKL